MQSGDAAGAIPRPETFSRGAAARGALDAAGDADLLRLCARGDQAALEELARRHQAHLFRFLYRLMGSAEDAEEAALEVFVRAWRHAGNFRHQASVSTWLFHIAANIARDARNRRLARPYMVCPDAYDLARHAVGDAEASALERLDRGRRAETLRAALATLGADDRIVLVLYYLAGREYAEMQAITGWSYPVLKTRLVRARRRLRERLEALGWGKTDEL